jgi:RNA polymerase sigma-70 factor, ECF subfamily
MSGRGPLLRRFGTSSSLRRLELNGEPAAQIMLGGQDSIVALEIRDAKVQSIFTVINPDKLARVRRAAHAASE